MSILIKGMEMPGRGEYRCIVRKWGEKITIDLYGDEDLCGILVPVPDHGRLIDADELLPIYADLMDGGDVKPVIPKAVIDTAPTIIEAEEKDNEHLD